MKDETRSFGRTIVTSAEFTRQFGLLRQSSGVDPVFVTHHGRETHVLIAASAYHDLVRGSETPAAPNHGPLPAVAEFATWIKQGCIVLDLDGQIVLANQTAQAMSRCDATMVGQHLYTAIPDLEGSLVQSYVNRAMAGRESCCADLPSIFRTDAWIRLEIYPSATNTTLLFHDITDDVRAQRLADPAGATIDAVIAHGGIGQIRIDVRGRIERVDGWTTALLGLAEDRLKGVAIADLVPRSQRAPFHELVDGVLGGAPAAPFDTGFLANDGTTVAIRGAIRQLSGIYGGEGAVIVLTRR